MTGTGKLDELRRAFDAAFAAPLPAPAELVDLIALRAASLSCAVRVAEIGSVVPFRGLAQLPCEEPALLGVAAVRGAVLPVYDLAALAGTPLAPSVARRSGAEWLAPSVAPRSGAESRGAPRWMLVTAGPDRVALAFDEIEEYLRVPRERLAMAAPSGAEAANAAAEHVRDGSSLRPVLSVASSVALLKRRLGLSGKER